MATRGGEAAGVRAGEQEKEQGRMRSGSVGDKLAAFTSCLCCCSVAYCIQHASSAETPWTPSSAPLAHEVWPQGAATQSTLLAICRPRRLHWEHKHVRCGGTCRPALPCHTSATPSNPPPGIPPSSIALRSNNKLQMKYTRITRRA